MKLCLSLIATLLLSCVLASASTKEGTLTLTIDNYNNWGWEECLIIENGFIELVIVPEIGGRVMRYAFPGDQQMAIHPKNIGKNFNPDTDKWGPWSGAWGYGGYKNWPAPQSFWNWPPPPHLCWGPYTYNIEHQSADSIVVYLESEVETQLAKGLQQARRFTVYNNSTIVKLEQYLMNVNASTRDLSIWDITQTIVQHDSDKDMENFSVYFSTSKSIRYADQKLNITKLDDGIHRYSDTNKSGKTFMNLDAGWCANVDERDSQSYYKIFEIDPSADHPDQNANFEIYSAGSNEYIEIEVLSPLQSLAKGQTMRYDQIWSAAHVNGIHYNANIAGSVVEKITVDNEIASISGSFGIFTSGNILVKAFDQKSNKSTTIEAGNVNAGDLFELNTTVTEIDRIDSVAVIARNNSNTEIGILSHWKNTSLGINDQNIENNIVLYPSAVITGQDVTINFILPVKQVSVKMLSIDGKIITISNNNYIENNQLIFSVPNINKGVYAIQIDTDKGNYNRRIVVK